MKHTILALTVLLLAPLAALNADGDKQKKKERRKAKKAA